MKQTKLSLLAAGLMAAGMMVSGQAMAAEVTASVSAKILTPITITKVDDMVFGNLIAGNGDVTLTPAGARSGTGILPVSTGVQAAEFTVGGDGNSTFSISTAGSSTSLSTGGESPSTMAIAFITDSTESAKAVTDANLTTGTLSAGSAKIYAGAKLTVGADQAAGNYSGSLVVTVAYN